MFDKNSERSMHIYRPKKVRRYNQNKIEIQHEQKSQNLKELHKTLCDQPLTDHKTAERSSAAQLLNRNYQDTHNSSHSSNPKRILSRSKDREK